MKYYDRMLYTQEHVSIDKVHDKLGGVRLKPNSSVHMNALGPL